MARSTYHPSNYDKRDVVSDNGPQLTSNDFVELLTNNGVKHFKSSLIIKKKTNGQLERTIQTLKSNYHKLINISNIHKRLSIVLLWYRISHHISSGSSPEKVMFRRKSNTLLDNIRPRVTSNLESASI
ncbi:hypothetical protein RF11_05922 [Thelohanellus kitauei]|uniref:Integrase catalytic domain-containing protein n=1 Tax=Thelohanellus kitauei TaxID=669202 RepID=A0A0C2N7C1_THEKT|nr:hypothetical protein RF11_05922 [Thelohanellus kitauei]